MNKEIQEATRKAYGRELCRLGGENEDIVVLDADLSRSTQTICFGEVFPERFFNMGIAEQNMLGTAAGLAAAGKIAFCSSFAVFETGRAFEIIRNGICYPGLNVKIAASHAGLTVGADGGTHQAIEDMALMRVLPNMTVLSPADAAEAAACVRAAVKIDGPVYIRLSRAKTPQVFAAEDYEIEAGRAVEVVPGSDATIISTGLMTARAIEAAEILSNEDISVRVLNFHTIKPLDERQIIKAAHETGAIITAEEHSVIGGLGSAVAEVVAENCSVPFLRIGIQDMFGQSGSADELLANYGLDVQDLVRAVKKILRKKDINSV